MNYLYIIITIQLLFKSLTAMKKKDIKKGQIVNVIYKGVEEFAEVLSVYHYENYSSILTKVFTDTGAEKNTFDFPEILSIHSN